MFISCLFQAGVSIVGRSQLRHEGRHQNVDYDYFDENFNVANSQLRGQYITIKEDDEIMQF